MLLLMVFSTIHYFYHIIATYELTQTYRLLKFYDRNFLNRCSTKISHKYSRLVIHVHCFILNRSSWYNAIQWKHNQNSFGSPQVSLVFIMSWKQKSHVTMRTALLLSLSCCFSLVTTAHFPGFSKLNIEREYIQIRKSKWNHRHCPWALVPQELYGFSSKVSLESACN